MLNGQPKRIRRGPSQEFKLEAPCRVVERQANGISRARLLRDPDGRDSRMPSDWGGTPADALLTAVAPTVESTSVSPWIRRVLVVDQRRDADRYRPTLLRHSARSEALRGT